MGNSMRWTSKILPTYLLMDHVKPGVTLFFELNQPIRANGAVYEFVRQFHGKEPQFTFIIGVM